MFASPRGLLIMASPNGHKIMNSNIVKAAHRQVFSNHPGSSIGDKPGVSGIPHSTPTSQSYTGQNFSSTFHHPTQPSYRDYYHRPPGGFNRRQPSHTDNFQSYCNPRWIHSSSFHQQRWSYGGQYSMHNAGKKHDDKNKIKRKYSTSPSEEASEAAYKAIDRAANWFHDDTFSNDKHFYSTKPSPQLKFYKNNHNVEYCEANQRDSGVVESKFECLDRHWVSTNPDKVEKRGIVPRSEDDNFSVVSYNILSQKLLVQNEYLYNDSAPEVLEWPFRWNNLQQELGNLNADVLCLQEVENFHYEKYIKPWLIAKGYHFCYKKRSGHDPLKPDGVLTAYKSSKFKIIMSSPVEYFRKNDPLTRANNVGLVVMLKMLTIRGKYKNCGNICIGNTHLLYNPKRGDIKLVQLATFFAEINDIMQRHKAKLKVAPSLVLCGDFNSTPDSPLYEFVTTGSLDYEGMEAKEVSGQRSHGGKQTMLQPNLLPERLQIDNTCSYSNYAMEQDYTVIKHSLGRLQSSQENKPDSATTIQNKGITVDYIFHSGCPEANASHSTQRDDNSRSHKVSSLLSKDSCLSVKLKLTGHLSAVTGEDISRANSLPNSKHSSDHLPVVAQFQVLLPSD